MSAADPIFHPDDSQPGSFESIGRSNGFRYWLASELMGLLEYTSADAFNKAINRAIAACSQLDIDVSENFVRVRTEPGARDWRLSRFACYLAVMNADPRKRRVAEAQAYFATMTEAVRRYVLEQEAVERVAIRGEVTERSDELAGIAQLHGVQQYAFFQNAGYRGLYNRDISALRALKGIPSKRSPLDFMGKEELAANLFRITQTEAKIRNENLRGQTRLENAAEQVGRTVRKTMIEISGTRPEDLPPADDIKKVRSVLKKAGREYAKIDAPTRKPSKRVGKGEKEA